MINVIQTNNSCLCLFLFIQKLFQSFIWCSLWLANKMFNALCFLWVCFCRRAISDKTQAKCINQQLKTLSEHFLSRLDYVGSLSSGNWDISSYFCPRIVSDLRPCSSPVSVPVFSADTVQIQTLDRCHLCWSSEAFSLLCWSGDGGCGAHVCRTKAKASLKCFMHLTHTLIHWFLNKEGVCARVNGAELSQYITHPVTGVPISIH